MKCKWAAYFNTNIHCIHQFIPSACVSVSKVCETRVCNVYMQSDSSKNILDERAKRDAWNIINAIYGLLSAISDFKARKTSTTSIYKTTSISDSSCSKKEKKTQTNITRFVCTLYTCTKCFDVLMLKECSTKLIGRLCRLVSLKLRFSFSHPFIQKRDEWFNLIHTVVLL